MEECKHLESLLIEQEHIIRRHIDQHKWYKMIADKNRAVEDFIEKYAWVMREMYCDLCPDSKECKPYNNYLKKNNGGRLNGFHD